MEHNAIQWLGAPSCQRGSFSFYKSVGSRTRPDGPLRTFRLGEFYFIRCGPQEPVCLAEVTLLWEDQTQRHPLASARLYFLPEDTPKGRTRDHGEDEVLAVSRKMVVKVEDLARWSCLEETNGWKIPSRTNTPKTAPNGTHAVLETTQDQDATADQTEDATADQTRDVTADQTEDTTADLTEGVTLDQTEGVTLDQTKGVTLDQTEGVTMDQTQDVTADQTQDVTADQTEDTTADQTEDTTADQTEDTTADQTEDTTADQTEGTTLDQTEGVTLDQTEGVTLDQTEGVTLDQTEGVTLDQTEGVTLDQTEGVTTPDQTQDATPDQTQDATPDQTQDATPDQTQDVTVEQTEDPTKDQIQERIHSQIEDRTEDQTEEQEVKAVGLDTEKTEAKTEEVEHMTEEVGLKAEEAELKMDDSGFKKEEEEEELKTEEAGLKAEEADLKLEESGVKTEEVEIKAEGVELKTEGVELMPEEVELKKDAAEDVAGGGADGQWVKVLSYPQYCRYHSLQRRTVGQAAGLTLQDPLVLALGGLKVALSHTRVMYCRDTFNHPTLEANACFSWQFRCPSLSLRGRPRKRKGRDGMDSPTSSQPDSWIDRMQENVMGSVESGCEGSWLPHPDEQFFLDQLFSFMDKQGIPIHKVPNLGFKKINLFLMYSIVKRLGGYDKVTNDRLWKLVYNELGGCPGSTSAATCTRRHYERLMLPYEEHLRAGGIEIRIPEFNLPPRPKGMRGRKPGRKPGPKPKDKKPTTPSAPRTIVNPDGTVVVKRGRGRPPGKKNKATLIAQAKLLAQQQAKNRTAAGEGKTGLKPRGRPPSIHRVPPLHTPQPIAPALIPVNMPLTPDLSPRSAPFLPFHPKPQDLKTDRPQCSATNNSTSATTPYTTNTTTTTTTTAVPTQGLLLSALPHHFVSGFSPIKGLCSLDVFRNRIQRGLEGPALNPQDPSQHLQQQQQPPHQIVYSIQPKMAENPQSLSQSPDANRNRLPLPPLRVLPLDLDCSVQVRQLMRTRLGSTQFQTFTRRLSEALSQDGASKPVSCSPITPPPEQNLPLNLSKRLPAAKRTHPDGALEANLNLQEGKRQKTADDLRSGHVSGQDVRMQEEPADLSSPSRIRAFLLGLPPFQVKLEEDLNGARFTKFVPESRRMEVENLGRKTQDDDVIIVEDDRDDDDDDEEQESVVFVKEEFNGKEAKGEKIPEENMEVLKPATALALAQHS